MTTSAASSSVVAVSLILPSASFIERTFSDLADYYEREHLCPPEYSGGVKVRGLHSYKAVRAKVARLRTYFADRPLPGIAYEDVRRFRAEFLQSPVERGHREGVAGGRLVTVPRPRTIFSVHRHLEVLRRMLKIARSKG